MYRYREFDRQFLRARAAQFRDQLERFLDGRLRDEEFKPLRLQNGWYVQRHAPMLRVAIPYGELGSRQLRQLARIAREFDRGFGHFTTRQNLQFNWIALDRAADVMDLLADVDMHGIQTSGNCIRNITTDAYAGIAPDEQVDPRPWCELLRQWSTLHPEFSFLPRKFKIAVTGATEDRAAIAWHDIGLRLHRNAEGEVGFEVLVGGGMGRTPLLAARASAFVPWSQILCHLEAIVRVYNRFGRRDNAYKARIKILVKAEGAAFFDAVEREFQQVLSEALADGPARLLTETERDAMFEHFRLPAGVVPGDDDLAAIQAGGDPALRRWCERSVRAHKVPGWCAVALSLKRPGQAPGDATADQMDAAADLADRYSLGELRVTHEQNLLLPWVRASDLPALHAAARDAGYGSPNIGLLTDMIACPGGDFCALANARSIPIAADLADRYDDLDALLDLGEIDLHISGCVNSCGHHHSGHIGVLGVDKDGAEWYQISLGGSDGSALAPEPRAGRVIGPSFAADEVVDAIEAIIDTFRSRREPGERFIDAVGRLGLAPFREAADAKRRSTARAAGTVSA